MTYDLAPLSDAMARCRSANVDVPIWWRDDDAINDTPALQRLLALAEEIEVPVHLAVIPAHADASLANAVADRPAYLLTHGWAHKNHSPKDQKKSEYGRERTDIDRELRDGPARIAKLFPNKVLPVFVPPWNRIAADIEQRLSAYGFEAISTFGPRQGAWPGLTRINTHIDPIAWRGDRDLVSPEQLIYQTVQCLEDRLSGKADAAEPLGFLTHHLVHTEQIWTFARTWLRAMRDMGARVWTHDPKGPWP